MEGHQQCKFPLVGSGGWTKVEFSTSGKVTSGAGDGVLVEFGQDEKGIS